MAAGQGETAPGLTAALSRPPGWLWAELFLAMVRSVMAQAETHQEVLRSQGMAENTPKDLGVLVGAHESALSQTMAGKRRTRGPGRRWMW